LLLQILKTLYRLRKERYDRIIDLQGMFKSSIAALTARGHERWTYQKNLMAEPLLWNFFDRYFFSSKSEHAVENYRKIGASIFGYEFSGKPIFPIRRTGLPRQNHSVASGQTETFSKPYIIFFPFASKSAKEIPAAQCIELIHQLESANLNVDFLLLAGSDSERRQAASYSSVSSHFRVAPPLSIGEVIGVIGAARGFVGADTGLTYLAAACEIPTVAVFVGTDPSVLDPGKWAKLASSVHAKLPNWSNLCVERLEEKIRERI
jgi:heptosyltransferase-1